jgi:NADPH:quinone reductase-like Zn-dependent oxidoreductase/NAD(P)-dependent dehydrogenase (short-subunit alcohol dehydrogenase family)
MPPAPPRTAIVTGASRGIGRAVALRLARDGLAVVVNYSGNATKAKEVVQQIAAGGGRALAVQADVAKAADVERLFEEAERAFGAVGVVVNSAGIMKMMPLATASAEDFDATFATNVRGTFNVLQQAARRVSDGGRVITFSTSVLALSLPNYGPYAASKAAVEVLTRTLANELRGRQITVNAVAPGPTATELFFEGKSPEQIDRFAKLAPLVRLGTPDDVASVVAFLAGPEGGWVNAQVLRANGGYARRRATHEKHRRKKGSTMSDKLKEKRATVSKSKTEARPARAKPSRARVVQFHKTGGPEVLVIEEVDLPPPGPDEVQIRIHALGLNRAEVMFRSGQYFQQPKLPGRPGYEAAGTVEAVGSAVKGLEIGEPISVVPSFSLNDYGVYGDLANVPARAVVRHPAILSWVDAAALWMQYLTAYGALIDIAALIRGDTVLIPAASSSVGLAAIQTASLVGAVPVALTRRSAKRQALLDAGAAAVIATEEQDLVSEALRLTGGQGARVVFDPVGGPTVAKLTRAMAHGGTLFLYGGLSPEPTTLSVLEMLGKSLTVRGYTLMEITNSPERLQRAVRFVNEGLTSGSMRPIIARTFPLEQIVEAHRFMESNEQIGKIVVTV